MRPCSTFLYICYNFRQIFCTNVIKFFFVENMGHNQLQKCTKYHLVSLLNEKQGSTFANFWHLFIHVTLLTHSALWNPTADEDPGKRSVPGTGSVSTFSFFQVHLLFLIEILFQKFNSYFFAYKSPAAYISSRSAAYKTHFAVFIIKHS